MRQKNWISRSFAKWTLALGVVMTGSLAVDSQAFGHHPFHRHGCFGSLGWSSHYYGGYSSFYGYGSSFGYPSFSFGYVPRFYSVSYYTPAYFAPVYYAPVYYSPAYYAPTYYAPACNSWSNIDYSTRFPLASNANPRYSAFANSPITSQARSELVSGRTEFIAKAVSDEKAVQLVSHKPALLQPYSPIWTKAAAGLVDEMIAAGEFDHAHNSCKSMDRITQPKGSGVYLRQALMSYFSADANGTKASIEEALKTLELACRAGCQVQPSELNKDSLHSYFASCLVDVSGSMDKLSESALESPSDSGKELLLLSALLKLDGQPERARLFATEAESQFAKDRSFQWHNLLSACLNETGVR